MHHVTSPLPHALILKVMLLCAVDHGFGVFGLTSYAQCASDRNLSSARRVLTCAVKRFCMSMSAFDADVKTFVKPAKTIDMIAITVIISTRL